MNDALRMHWIEDDALYVAAFSNALAHQSPASKRPLKWQASKTLEAARTALASRSVDVIVLDVHLAAGERGLTFLPELQKLAPHAPVIVHSVLSDYATVVEAMRLGAYDYLPKQAGIAQLIARIYDVAALAAPRQTSQRDDHPAPQTQAAVAWRSEPFSQNDAPALLGESRSMEQLRAQIARIQQGLGGVLITGESGSGKELIARALAPKDKPFVAVDAATLCGPMGLATLLGHEKGAYTGADGARPGLFERAHGGILFIDEVANMPLDVQAQLLRALEQRTTTRLGGTKERKSLFRLVTATHANLEELCRKNQFRFDLLMRLRVFVLAAPALRERPEDIVALFTHFLRRFGVDAPLADETSHRLVNYSWPGNVRELLHAAEHAATLHTGGEILPQTLPQTLLSPHCSERPVALAPAAQGYHAQLQAFSRHILESSYAAEGGNISRMATKLGLERASLHHKLCALGIHRPKRRGADARTTP